MFGLNERLSERLIQKVKSPIVNWKLVVVVVFVMVFTFSLKYKAYNTLCLKKMTLMQHTITSMCINQFL